MNAHSVLITMGLASMLCLSAVISQATASDDAAIPATVSKTELSQYKAKVYREVGSRWYFKVNQLLQILPEGKMQIRFTVHADGSVSTEGESDSLKNNPMATFRRICIDSINESAPFDPFSDSMRKQVGESFTDEFIFTIADNPSSNSISASTGFR